MKHRNIAKVPQRRNADATRAKILQAALAEFSDHGLPAASTDAIAERCGVNKRMIYYYFGSKEGLYLAALELVFENLVALEKKIEIEHLEPPAAITAMINLKIDYYLDNPHFISFLSMENFYKGRHLRKSKKLKMFKTPLTEVIARILKRGQLDGQFQARYRSDRFLRFDLRAVHHVFFEPAHARPDLRTQDDQARHHRTAPAHGRRFCAQLSAHARRRAGTAEPSPRRRICLPGFIIGA